MTDYNPNSPAVIGLEWRPDTIYAAPIVGGNARMAMIQSTVTETVTSIILPCSSTSAEAPNVTMDVYDITGGWNPPPLDTDTKFEVPGSDYGPATSPGWTRSDNGLSSNLYQMVNDDPIHPDDPGFTSSTHISCGPASGGRSVFFTGAGAFHPRSNPSALFTPDSSVRIHDVYVRLLAQPLANTLAGGLGWVYAGLYDIAGKKTAHGGLAFPALMGVIHEFTWLWAWNPFTGRSWTVADVIGFASGTDYAYGLWASAPAAGEMNIHSLQLEIAVTTETRVAVVRSGRKTSGLWTGNFQHANVNADATWAKQAGKRYGFVTTLTHEVAGNATLPLLAQSDGGGVVGHRSTTVPIYGTGLPMPVTDPPVESTAAYAVDLVTSGGTVSADSQVYASSVAATVYAGTTAKTTVTVPADGMYGMVTAVVRPFGYGVPLTTADLTLTLWAGPTAIAGPLPVRAADLGWITLDWKSVQVRFVSTVAIAAGTYTIEAASATDAAHPWYVNILTARGSDGSTDPTLPARTYAGTAGLATYATATTAIAADTYADAEMTLMTVPSPPSSLTVGVSLLDNYMLGECAPSTVGYAAISWDASTLGALFAEYDVERNDDGTWSPIATVTTESRPYFNDLEVRRNKPALYRVRTVRTDGAYSDWATTGAVTVLAGTADIVLACNGDPKRTIVAVDNPGYEYHLNDVDDSVTMKLFGVDYAIGFRPTERRGDTFTRKVVLAFSDPAVGVTVDPGRAVFDRAEAIVHARDLPYTALCDGRGRRWFAFGTITAANEDEPGGIYTATIQFVQMSAVPVPTTAQWTPT